MNKIFGCVFFLLQSFSFASAQTDSVKDDDIIEPSLLVPFYTNPDTVVNLKIREMELTYTFKKRNGEIKSVTVQQPEATNPISILIIDDFDFNGDLDFAIASSDMGMGTYYIYRVFLYSREKEDFVEQRTACVINEFFDLKLDKKNKQLLSTYWMNNKLLICKTKLKPMK